MIWSFGRVYFIDAGFKKIMDLRWFLWKGFFKEKKMVCDQKSMPWNTEDSEADGEGADEKVKC